MKVKRLKVGCLNTNCYVLINGKNALLVDPGDDYEVIKYNLSGLCLIGILITHSHFDHVGALKYFDRDIVYDYGNLKPGIFKIGDFCFEVLETKGHSDDSLSFYFKNDKCMFVGDFVFKGSIGRTDLPAGSMRLMLESIEKIKCYPKDIVIYPGHGESTTLNFEIMHNCYFNRTRQEVTHL